jgi:hypothetical protein
VIDYCVGELAGPDYKVVSSGYDFNYALVLEGGNPTNGDPVNFFFEDMVIFENKSNPDDYHVFTATGRSIPASVVPLPATIVLMVGALACTAGVSIRRRCRSP